jgi:NADH:ubiquinone oxidoreductase subunit 5 (subunit L)/multisubunit Na+/H+ antiporter MnhA subunit
VLWALAQHDIKRLLAYHSVENIGIILMGMGIGVLGTYYGHPVIAVAGYAGAVLHTINHALFKSLLFLGAGAVYRATHTLHMEELGGLAARMPHTWLAFAIGATAIVGLPPLNGFVSEWLVFQGMFRAGQADEVVRLAALGVPALGLIGALALACFAKVSGITFLGSPRSAAARDASDPALGQRVAMLSLAGACVLLGIVPTLGVGPAIAAASSIAQVPLGESVDVNVLVGDAIWIGVVAALLCALVALGWLARRSLLRRQSVRNSATWACGYDGVTPRMQYSASSFASPLLNAFGAISGVREQRDANSFASHAHDLVLDGIVRPLWERIRVLALRLRPLQQGRLHAYLIYVMVALVTLLAYVAFEAGP